MYMQITFPLIQRTFNASYNKNTSRKIPVNFKGTCSDTFKRSQQLDDYYYVKDNIELKRKITPKEFYELTPQKIKSFLTWRETENMDDAANENITIAMSLKKFLDEKYGKDKYVFVSIGTSPAPIARVFEFMGVETKYIPVSGLSNIKNIQEITENPYFENYKKFIEEQGIEKETIKKGDKTYIFYDYTNTGASLNVFKDLMLNGLKLPEGQVDFRSLSKDITSLKDKIGQKNYCDAVVMQSLGLDDTSLASYYIGYYLTSSIGSYYGGLGHLHYSGLHLLPLIVKRHYESAKIYNLTIMSKLNDMGLLVHNPKNNDAL